MVADNNYRSDFVNESTNALNHVNVESNNKFVEPILQENPNRFTLYPIIHKDVYDMYQKSISCFWTVPEIDLSKDISDWDKLSDNEQYFIKNILAFFAGADGIVNENLGTRFMNECQWPEIRCFYGFQIMIENIHNETYSLLIDTYIKDNNEKMRLLNAIETIPCIKKKAEWGLKYITSQSDNFAIRLIAFAIIEGVFFSGAFASIYWLKESHPGLMMGLRFANDLISRDEALHTEFAVLLYSHIRNRVSAKDVHKLFKEAVDIEVEFITESLPCNLLGMNSKNMIEYVQFVADRLLVQLGYEKLYHSRNPFPFMNQISLTGNVNFFETRNDSYTKASSVMADKSGKIEFAISDDF